MEGQWKEGGGGKKGRRRRREDKKEQKQDKRVGHVVVIKKPKQRLIQRTAHRRTTLFSVAVETTAEKRAQCHDNHNPSPTPVLHLAPSTGNNPNHHQGFGLAVIAFPTSPPLLLVSFCHCLLFFLSLLHTDRISHT